jgi:hypothetical protein
MSSVEAIYPSWRVLRKSAADDAYQAWANAHERCEQTLRAWREASGPSSRATAYLDYCFALDHEEAAAIQLHRLHRRAAA